MSLISGVYWSMFLFNTVGIWIGLQGFKTFKNNEYYMYANLGFTKSELTINVFFMNVFISLPFLFLLLTFF